MMAIILEGVLFVALLATGAALLFYVVTQFTPVGVRLRQTQNRKRIERAAGAVCAAHGAHEESDLVRLPSGEQICPDCYKEAFDG
ncbi:MAG: hypothetical protein WKG32_13475 [Gemmatimonadaceae bacterium]